MAAAETVEAPEAAREAAATAEARAAAATAEEMEAAAKVVARVLRRSWRRRRDHRLHSRDRTRRAT